MRYPLVGNRFLRAYLYIFDFFCLMFKCLFPQRVRTLQRFDIKKVRRILLRNPAAFGDVLYTLRLATALKKRYPYIEIGLVVGSWVRPLVEISRDITYVHYEDHWAVSRSKQHILQRFFRWWNDRRRVLGEIREKHYDIAIDLYYYFPSSAFLFYQAGIPCRVGYDSNGGGALLSKRVSWSIVEQHNVEYQAALLNEIGFSLSREDLIESEVGFSPCKKETLLFTNDQIIPGRYIVVHVGTGAESREWCIDRWVSLINSLGKCGLRIFFTGQGKREKFFIEYILQHTNVNAISFCDQISLSELFVLIKNTRLFIGLESFAGHIAAMYKIPQVSIMHGASNQSHWQPYHNENCIVIRKKLDCSPCYFPSQCKYNNLCMDILPEDVIGAVRKKLKLMET